MCEGTTVTWASLACQPSPSVSTEQLPYLKCPLHTVLKLTPVAYGKETSCALTLAARVWLSACFRDFLQTPYKFC